MLLHQGPSEGAMCEVCGGCDTCGVGGGLGVCVMCVCRGCGVCGECGVCWGWCVAALNKPTECGSSQACAPN